MSAWTFLVGSHMRKLMGVTGTLVPPDAGVHPCISQDADVQPWLGHVSRVTLRTVTLGVLLQVLPGRMTASLNHSSVPHVGVNLGWVATLNFYVICVTNDIDDIELPQRTCGSRSHACIGALVQQKEWKSDLLAQASSSFRHDPFVHHLLQLECRFVHFCQNRWRVMADMQFIAVRRE